jgi:hypothetical protein
MLIHYAVNSCASIIGVAVPVLVASLLTANNLVLVFEKRVDWFHPTGSDHRFTSIGDAK